MTTPQDNMATPQELRDICAEGIDFRINTGICLCEDCNSDDKEVAVQTYGELLGKLEDHTFYWEWLGHYQLGDSIHGDGIKEINHSVSDLIRYVSSIESTLKDKYDEVENLQRLNKQLL